MEVIEAIKTRKTIRAFLPEPVSREVLAEVLEVARRAPSWANTQPWEVAVLGGEVMGEVKAALIDAATSGETPGSDIPQIKFEDPYLARSRGLGFGLYEVLGIGREDREKRQEWALQGRKFFDAPSALIFYLDAVLGTWSMLDLGLFAQSVMLAALNFGLGTSSLAVVAAYPKILRRILSIPESKKIAFGMAIGYPDWSHPANKFQSQREEVENFATWHGF